MVTSIPGFCLRYDFVDEVIHVRIPNPFMPDAPQRIATDTSQKLSVRFGETIKTYQSKGLNINDLILIPLVLAGYARYIKGVDDGGNFFTPSPDPLLTELQATDGSAGGSKGPPGYELPEGPV